MGSGVQIYALGDSLVRKCPEGVGDGSVLLTQVLEFNPPRAHSKKSRMQWGIIIPALGRKKTGALWGPVTSQPRLMHKY